MPTRESRSATSKFWSGGGQDGALTVTRTSRTRVRIGEIQALT